MICGILVECSTFFLIKKKIICPLTFEGKCSALSDQGMGFLGLFHCAVQVQIRSVV